ncbi:MAG TPA: hypothetical protein VGM27_06975 [Acidobacteriaceae bacterium]|jgi:hypothetical protein
MKFMLRKTRVFTFYNYGRQQWWKSLAEPRLRADASAARQQTRALRQRGDGEMQGFMLKFGAIEGRARHWSNHR